MPTYSAEYLEIHGVPVDCKCPTCGRIHVMRIKWEGRGMPRKYCPKHQRLSVYYGDDNLSPLNTRALMAAQGGL
jgi:phage FluMu protein Com